MSYFKHVIYGYIYKQTGVTEDAKVIRATHSSRDQSYTISLSKIQPFDGVVVELIVKDDHLLTNNFFEVVGYDANTVTIINSGDKFKLSRGKVNIVQGDLKSGFFKVEKKGFAKLTKKGEIRVLDGKAGMIFEIDKVFDRADGSKFYAVKDYRYPTDYGFQVWTIDSEGLEIL